MVETRLQLFELVMRRHVDVVARKIYQMEESQIPNDRENIEN